VGKRRHQSLIVVFVEPVGEAGDACCINGVTIYSTLREIHANDLSEPADPFASGRVPLFLDEIDQAPAGAAGKAEIMRIPRFRIQR